MILIVVQWSFKKKPLFLRNNQLKGYNVPNMLSKQLRKKNVNICEGRRGKTGKEGGKREREGRAKRMNCKAGEANVNNR